MEALQFKVIKTEKQYFQYCKKLADMCMIRTKNKYENEVIDLLTLLIEKWDEHHNSFTEVDPIEILRYLMRENDLKSVDLAKDLSISPALISDILNYRRGFSKDNIRKLSQKFKVNQELFNRPYKLVPQLKGKQKRDDVRIRKVS